jgi:hypothetical protein
VARSVTPAAGVAASWARWAAGADPALDVTSIPAAAPAVTATADAEKIVRCFASASPIQRGGAAADLTARNLAVVALTLRCFPPRRLLLATKCPLQKRIGNRRNSASPPWTPHGNQEKPRQYQATRISHSR